MFKFYSIIGLVLLLTSCTATVSIDGFDKEAWVNDKDGCNGDRKEIIKVLENNKDKLLGKDQSQIKKELRGFMCILLNQGKVAATLMLPIPK